MWTILPFQFSFLRAGIRAAYVCIHPALILDTWRRFCPRQPKGRRGALEIYSIGINLERSGVILTIAQHCGRGRSLGLNRLRMHRHRSRALAGVGHGQIRLERA